jgi:thymidylate synthase (FAD)
MSFAKPRPGGNAAYLGHIKEVGHGSVLEHSVWSLVFTGVSRSLTHELVRHRAGMSYSQLSQRYVDESVAEYVEPDVIAADPELHEVWVSAVAASHAAYVVLAERLAIKAARADYDRYFDRACDSINLTNGPLSFDDWFVNAKAAENFNDTERRTARRKEARQAARSVLPNATETKIFVTANGRALRHFCEQRGSKFADPEIRKLANRLLDVLQAESANLFGDYTREPLPDGTFAISTKFSKV